MLDGNDVYMRRADSGRVEGGTDENIGNDAEGRMLGLGDTVIPVEGGEIVQIVGIYDPSEGSAPIAGLEGKVRVEDKNGIGTYVDLEVKKSEIDLISEVLMGLGSLSITYSDALDDAIYEPPVGQTPLWDSVKVIALFSSEANQKSIEASILEICNITVIETLELKHLQLRQLFAIHTLNHC